VSTEIPLFPLRSVLCPGVALPLHIFEERYRLMVGRCLERDEPFGVVLVREGSEVGPIGDHIAHVGTTAVIRRAGRYPDGRYDILTVGAQRFVLRSVDRQSQPWLVGHVDLLDEPLGSEDLAREQAARVGRRFLRYLELLQPTAGDGGPEIEIEIEIEVDDDESVEPDDEASTAGDEERTRADAPEGATDEQPSPSSGRPGQPLAGADRLLPEVETGDLSPEERRDLLMTAARRLTATDDPTALSYVLTALIQVDLAVRQELLEEPDTLARLERLERLLVRESWFLGQGLRPMIIDPGQFGSRRT
jgi:Lon protease-like protein